MLAKQWLTNVRSIMDTIEETQMDNIRKAAEVMAKSIEEGRWVHTFGCGHATLPIEEMYPRIAGGLYMATHFRDEDCLDIHTGISLVIVAFLPVQLI